MKDLKKSEKYIVKSISNGKVYLKNGDVLREYVKEEALNDGLITKLKYFGGKFVIIMASVIVIYLICFFLMEVCVVS